MTTVGGLEPTETRLLLCAAISLGDVVAFGESEHREWRLVYRESGRRYDRTAAVNELIREGWASDHHPLTPCLTTLGEHMLATDLGARVLKRYRETT